MPEIDKNDKKNVCKIQDEDNKGSLDVSAVPDVVDVKDNSGIADVKSVMGIKSVQDIVDASVNSPKEIIKAVPPVLITADTLAAIEDIINEAHCMQHAYFFDPPTSASMRRWYERKHSREEVTWTEGGRTYSAAFYTRCSCRYVYARGSYYRDGEKTTLTAIKFSYERLLKQYGGETAH